MHIEDEYVIRVKVRQDLDVSDIPTITVECPELDPTQSKSPEYLLKADNLLPQIRFIPPSNSKVTSANASRITEGQPQKAKIFTRRISQAQNSKTSSSENKYDFCTENSREENDKTAQKLYRSRSTMSCCSKKPSNIGLGSLYVPKVPSHMVRDPKRNTALQNTSNSDRGLKILRSTTSPNIKVGPRFNRRGSEPSVLSGRSKSRSHLGPKNATLILRHHCSPIWPYRNYFTRAITRENISEACGLQTKSTSKNWASDPRKMLVEKDCRLDTDQFDVENKPTAKHDAGESSAAKYIVRGELFDADDSFYQYPQQYPPYNVTLDGSFCDPGYVSERSDEDDLNLCHGRLHAPCGNCQSEANTFLEMPKGLEPTLEYIMKVCPFINDETMFDVTITKNSRGLGIALTGGIECDVNWAGLIRIKKVYPQGPAFLSGQLQINDLILEANQNVLTGLSSHEALEVLRMTGDEVTLLVCRPPPGSMDDNTDTFSAPFDATDSLAVPTSFPHLLSPSPSFSSCGEFEIQLSKLNGSLGFTLRKQDNSILGHTVKSLVKEPALSDGRIRPGDKLLSVNGTDMCGLTHEQAVQFLRTCPQSVVIRLYRDTTQTPVSPASPTESEFIPRPKQLRKEARDMLCDLASRKQSSSHQSSVSSETPGTTRRRRLQKTPSPDLKAVVNDRWESLVRDSSLPYNNSSQYSLDEPKPNRPNFLNLKSTEGSSRKANFTPPHEQQPYSYSPQMNSLDSAPQLSSTHGNFPHAQHAYHSVNLGTLNDDLPHLQTSSDNDLHCNEDAKNKNGLMKWKGVLFSDDQQHDSRHNHIQSLDSKVITIELSRGWNSRLGFSLRPKDNHTVIANVYEDSVAAKDGRLKVGDQVLTVNDEDVCDWPTEKVIDYLRKTTGKITLTIRQKYF